MCDSGKGGISMTQVLYKFEVFALVPIAYSSPNLVPVLESIFSKIFAKVPYKLFMELSKRKSLTY